MDKLFIGIAALLFGVGTLLFSKRGEAAIVNENDKLEPIEVPDLHDFRGRADLPRGIRNNNPGNIEDVGIPWLGLVGNDGRYAIFSNALYGIRAMMIDIHTGFVRDNENTVRKIINEWAPNTENDTESYVRAVANRMAVSPDQKLTFGTHIIPLAKAITRHENGENPYPHTLYMDALRETGK